MTIGWLRWQLSRGWLFDAVLLSILVCEAPWRKAGSQEGNGSQSCMSAAMEVVADGGTREAGEGGIGGRML